MSSRVLTHLIACAEVGDRAEDGSVWIELAASGRMYSQKRGGRSVEVDREHLQQMADNMAAFLAERWAGSNEDGTPRGVPIRLDLAHADADKDPADQAAAPMFRGHVVEAKLSERDGRAVLLGRVQWTDEGRLDAQALSVSIEAYPDRQSKATGEPIEGYMLTGVVLTDKPMVRDLRIAASDHEDPHTPEPRMPLSVRAREILALSESPAESAVEAAVLALAERAEKAEGERDTLKEQALRLSEERDTLKAELDKHAEAEAQRLDDQAVADGRITAAERPEFRKVRESVGVELAEKLYPAGRHNVTAKSTHGGADAKPMTLAEVEKHIADRTAALVAEGKSASEAIRLTLAEVNANPAMRDHLGA